MRHAEIITVGTEITSGSKLDTNSQWLSSRLTEVGIVPRYLTSVADDLETNVEAFRLAMQRADVVLITGGLGPTRDDLTRPALAEATRRSLVEDPVSLAAIEAMFRSRGREMPAANRLQARLPEGALALANPVGTAPGIWMEVPLGERTCRIAAFPGVPSEMKRMFREQVQPRLLSGRVIRKAQLNCFGMGESRTEELLGDLTMRGRDPEIGITAHEATISLRIIAQAESEADCQHKLDLARQQLRELLREAIFGEDEQELEDVVVDLLRERQVTVGICEGATAGNLVQRILHADAGRGACAGGIVLGPPGTQPFFESLNLPELRGTEAGQEAAGRLASACRDRFGADYGLAITGWGTTWLEGGTDVAAVWLALSGPEGVTTAEARSTGNPAIFASRTAKHALDLLRRRLLDLPLTIES